MAVIRISPERLRDASQHLAQVNAQLDDHMRRLASLASFLQSDWQGMGSQEFQQEFYGLHSLSAQASESANRLAALLAQHSQKLAAMQGGGGAIAAGGSAAPMGSSPMGSAPMGSSGVGAGVGSSSVLMAGGVEAPVDMGGAAMASAPVAPDPMAMAGGQSNVVIGGGHEVAMGGAQDPLSGFAGGAAAGAVASTDVMLGGAGGAVAYGGGDSSVIDLTPKLQHDGDNCGKTAVAMAVNAVTGKNLEDWDLPAEGCSLLGELNARSADAGVTWVDKDLSAANWHHLEQSLQQGVPVVVGLNGEFSASGYGHIVTIVGVEGETVSYADPATGTIRETTREAILNCPPHTDGKFMMFGQRTG